MKKIQRSATQGLVLLMIAILLVITACSSKQASEPPAAEPAAESPSTKNEDKAAAAPTDKAVKLGITWWGPDARHEATLNALELYTSQNPSVTFSPEYMAWDGFWTKLPTLVASKKVPDVLQMDAAYIREYVANGTLEDLSDIDLNGIIDQKIIDNLKIDGKLYGIPLTINATGMAFNKAELEAAGITLPKPGWTWDDYFAFAREARKKLPADKYPVGHILAWEQYQYYQTAQGKAPMFQDEGKIFNLDKETFVSFYTRQLEMLKEGILPPIELQASFVDGDPQADPVASGKVMSKNVTVNAAVVLETLMPGQIEVLNNPVGPGGGGWAQSTVFFSVSANSPHKAEAKEFIKWLLTNPEAGKALMLTRGIPVNEAIYKEIEPLIQPQDVIGKKLIDAAKPYAHPFYGAAAGYTELLDLFLNETTAIMYGQRTVEEAYNNINDLGQKIAESK